MSVATKNPFALLDDETSRPSSPAAASAKESTPAESPATTRGTAKPRVGPASRGGKYYARGGAKPSSGSSKEPGGGNLNQNGIEETPVKFEGRGRGRGRGGRGGGSGGGSGRGRPFDKHSQTGKTDSDKKVHQSWGGDDGDVELKTEEAATQDAAAEGAAADAWGADTTADADAWGASTDPSGFAAPAAPSADAPSGDAERGERRRREREPEEEDNTLTLDQYLAQQKEKESALVPKLEGSRKVEENWKDVVPLQKAEDEAYFVGKTKSTPKARTKKEEKVYLEIDAKFERPSRGGPRGGRGGGERRGRGGRGGPRGGGVGRQTTGAAINVDDETAFPSLS